MISRFGLPAPAMKVRFLMILCGALVALTLKDSAAHPFYSSTWNDCGAGLGCIGWQQFQNGSPNTYVRVNGVQDQSDTASAFVWGISYWNGAGTVASYQVNAQPQNFPLARIAAYRYGYGPYYAQVMRFDLIDPGVFAQCFSDCYLSNQTFALPGQDLAEVIYYDNNFNGLSYTDKIKASRHEIGHFAGLSDHHEDGYPGLMKGSMPLNTPNNSTLTCAERNSVSYVHDRAAVC